MITKLLQAISILVSWFFSDKQITKREHAAKDKAAADAVDAVRRKDVDKVNNILRRNLGIVLISVFCLSGCATSKPPVYIMDEDKVLPIEYEGRQGWFVPDRVFESMMVKIAKGDN